MLDLMTRCKAVEPIPFSAGHLWYVTDIRQHQTTGMSSQESPLFLVQGHNSKKDPHTCV